MRFFRFENLIKAHFIRNESENVDYIDLKQGAYDASTLELLLIWQATIVVHQAHNNCRRPERLLLNQYKWYVQSVYQIRTPLKIINYCNCWESDDHLCKDGIFRPILAADTLIFRRVVQNDTSESFSLFFTIA